MPHRLDYAARSASLYPAIYRLAAEGGVGALTVRAVAAAIGMSPGSLRYQFPSQARLIELGMRRLQQDRAQHPLYRAAYSDNVRDATDPEADYVTARRAYLRGVCLASLPLDEERLVQTKAWLAFEDAARHDPVLGAVSFRACQERLASGERWLRIVGVPDEQLRAEALPRLALLDGLVAGMCGPTDRFPSAGPGQVTALSDPFALAGPADPVAEIEPMSSGEATAVTDRYLTRFERFTPPKPPPPARPSYTVFRAGEDRAGRDLASEDRAGSD